MAYALMQAHVFLCLVGLLQMIALKVPSRLQECRGKVWSLPAVMFSCISWQGVKSEGTNHSVALFFEDSEQLICPLVRCLSWKCSNATVGNTELPIGVSARCEVCWHRLRLVLWLVQRYLGLTSADTQLSADAQIQRFFSFAEQLSSRRQ